METTAEKNARLRALREARDGTPEERRARKQARRAVQERIKKARENAFFDALGQAVRDNPDAVLDLLQGRR